MVAIFLLLRVKTTSVNYTYKDLKSEYFDLKCFRQNAYSGEPETYRDWIGGIGCSD